MTASLVHCNLGHGKHLQSNRFMTGMISHSSIVSHLCSYYVSLTGAKVPDFEIGHAWTQSCPCLLSKADYSKHPHSNIARTIHRSSSFSCQRLYGIAKNLISCSTPLRTYLRVDSTVATKECYPNLEGEEIMSDTLQNVTISPVQNKMVSSLFLSMKIHACVAKWDT